MNVFILCTGRSGSTTFMRACKHLTNFTSGHESLSGKIGSERLNYPDWHIESDNRLSWFLGLLDKKYGDKDVFYIHLRRSKEKTVESYNGRWHVKGSIVKAFTNGILMTPLNKTNEEKRLQICNDYYDTVNANIELFLKDKTNKLTVTLENIEEGFTEFWNKIPAEGNFEDAIMEFRQKHNENVWAKYPRLAKMKWLIRLYRKVKLLAWGRMSWN